MGRHKVDMKKIENVTRCQVTFSKRRSSLINKAHEISVFCNVDLAFVTFSPSGRLSKFSSQNRIEDVLHRYINLPADKRNVHIKNVEEKLRKLDHIKGDGNNKLHHLNKKIERIEREIKSKDLELQILEDRLRDFEPDPEQEPSLAQLLWCERNLKNSLRHVVYRKKGLLRNSPSSDEQFNVQMEMEMEKQGGTSNLYNFDGKELNLATQNPYTSHLLIQLDPSISPYSSKVRESILQDQLNRGKGISIGNGVLGMSNDYTSNLPFHGFPSMHQSGISSLAPETLITPIYTQNQQAVAGNRIVPPLLPNQQLRVLESSSMHPTQTFGHHEKNLNRQDCGIPMFQFNTYPEKVNWFTSCNQNPSQNLNVFAPMNSERIESPLVYEPLLTACAAAAATTTNSSSCSNRNGGCDAYEEHIAAPGQVDPPHEHPENLPLPNDLSIEDVMGNDALWTAGNKESDSWEWDGFVLPENLNLEDLGILI